MRHTVITIRFNNRRREIRIPVRRNNLTEIHPSADKDLIVLEHGEHIAQAQRLVGRSIARISGEFGAHELTLLFRQPLRVFGKVAHDKEGDDSHHAGHQSFDDEHPAPAAVSADTLHLAESVGKDAAEGAGKRGRAEEEAEALLCFAAFVPHSHKVEAYLVLMIALEMLYRGRS